VVHVAASLFAFVYSCKRIFTKTFRGIVVEAGSAHPTRPGATSHGYTATRLHGYTATWLQGYKATRLHGYTATRLQGYKATRLHGYTAARFIVKSNN
jgi:hypothetical protein